ncbi:MAG TPA: efflux RND transporter periplasmic adaptor subunit [Pirellulales bacterium]|jgi:HlyD family secretion protein|nr:efflux RND transporter periplasmic adaptor subunit [Pirellulales bacterium]
MKKGWLLILIAALIGMTTVGYSSWAGGVRVAAARCQRDTIREYIDEEGKTRLAETYLITMPFDGRVEPIDLVEGTSVSKEQVVARIKPLDIDLDKAAARAIVDRLKASIKENDDVTVESTSLQQTISLVESVDRMVEAAATRVKSGQAKVDFAEKYLSRTERLAKTNASAERELDQAKVSQVESSMEYQRDVLALRAAEAMRAATALLPTMVRQYIQRKLLGHDVLAQQLAEAEVHMRDSEKRAQLGTMSSPVDGIVLERAVSNERQLASGTVLLRIGRWEDLEIEADVLSQDVVRVKPGQMVEVHGPAIGPQAATAQVTRVFPAGFTKVSSLGVEQQRVKVIMKFAADDLRRLRENNDLGVDYRVRVRLYTAQASGSLVVPRSALFRGTDHDWRVFTVRRGRAHLQPVVLGLSNDDMAEITAGLEENDEVILAPETDLVEGQRVQVLATGSERS